MLYKLNTGAPAFRYANRGGPISTFSILVTHRVEKVAFKRCGCRQFINAIATLQRATNLGLLPKKTNHGRLNKVGPNVHKIFIVFS